MKALKNSLRQKEQKYIPTEKLINVVEFVLRNNFFEFNVSAKQQVSRTVIGTKRAPTYGYMFMDKVQTEFLKTQERTPLVCFKYLFHLGLL